MMYKAKVAVCSEICIKKKNNQRKANTVLNFSMLNLMVRNQTARL